MFCQLAETQLLGKGRQIPSALAELSCCPSSTIPPCSGFRLICERPKTFLMLEYKGISLGPGGLWGAEYHGMFGGCVGVFRDQPSPRVNWIAATLG